MGKAKYTLTISIHAAREGGDPRVRGKHQRSANFNPRRP